MVNLLLQAMRYSERPGYEEEGLLGKGSFAQVHRVRLQGKLFALKRIYNYHLKDPNYSKSIRREITIMKKLDHPNIVKLIDVYEGDNSLEILLQYLPNGNLYDKIKSQDRLSEATVKGYMLDIVKAVKYLHSFPEPILHRDIKPENILLSEDNRVKICDFGSANMVVPDHIRDSYVGTAEYMAPQMKQCKPHDQTLDLWCIGVLAYELLTGHVPDSQGEIQYPDYISRPAEDLMKRILVKQQNKRITIEEIESHIWFAESENKSEINSFLVGATSLQNSTMIERTKQRLSRLRQKLQSVSQKQPSSSPVLIASSSQIGKIAEQAATEYVGKLKRIANLQSEVRRNDHKIQAQKCRKQTLQKMIVINNEAFEKSVQQIKNRNLILASSQPTNQQKCKQTLIDLSRKLDRIKEHALQFPQETRQKILEFKEVTIEPVTMPISEYLPKLWLKVLEKQRDALIQLKLIKIEQEKREQVFEAAPSTKQSMKEKPVPKLGPPQPLRL